MRLLLLCAAATPGLRRGIFPSDEPLDAQGLALAARCAPLLPRAQVYWSGPAQSTVQTAKTLGIDAASIDALRECDYGLWAGQDLRAVETSDPEGYAAWLTNPAAGPHGGEAISDLIDRVGAWLDGLSSAQDALAVTHASVIRAAIVHARHAPASAYAQAEIAPLTLTELRRDPVGWTVGAIGVAPDSL